jgi:hypothetical protein
VLKQKGQALSKKIDKLFKKAHFTVPLFQCDCYFFDSQDAYKKAAQSIGVDIITKGTAGKVDVLIHDDDGIEMYFIGVFDNRKSTAVHEAVHVALFICENVGIDARNDSGEVVSYLTQRITEACWYKMDAAG